MFPITELYPIFTEHYADIPEVQQGIVRIAWNYCVGEKIRLVSEPLYFHNGVLNVRVTEVEWELTLASMKQEIIQKINRYLKKQLVHDFNIEAP